MSDAPESARAPVSDAVGSAASPETPGGRWRNRPGACPAAAVWRAFLEGEVAESERNLLDNHFENCTRCASLVTKLTGWRSGSGGPEGAGSPQPGLPDDALLSLVHRPSPFASTSPAPPRTVEVPVVPGFHSLTEVGRGGSGIVYRAVQESLERVVAIKVLSTDALARGRHRIEREARALARLKHPHIVAIYESGLMGQVPYLVMEWLEAGSLQDRIDRGPLEVQETAQLLRQLAHTVEAVHALGIVHRDLKPANVLLEPDAPGGTLSGKLTDFGLAQDHQQQHRVTHSETVVGTPAYMAPEQTGMVDSPGEATAACDIYGLGAIAYACLTGHPPHRGRSTLDTLVRVASDEPVSITLLRPEVPAELALIIAKSLRARPADRYPTAADLAADLDRFLAGRPITARPYTRWERGLKWVRRHPAQATAAGLLAVLVAATIGGVGYHIWRQDATLRELELEKRKVDLALREATEFATAERRLKGQVLEQLTLTPLMLLQYFARIPEESPEESEDQRALLRQIRESLRRQTSDPRDLDPQIATVVVKGLAALSHSEELRFGLIDHSLADLDLSLELTRRYPDSETLRDLEAQMLLLRYRQAVRLGRTERAAETVEQIQRLCDRLADDPQRTLGSDKLVYLASTLLELGHPAAGLPLVNAVVSRARQSLPSTGEPDAWRRLLNALPLQARLLEELGDFSGSDSTVEAWKRAVAEGGRRDPGIEATVPEVQFEFTLMRLARAGRLGDRAGVPQLLEEAARQIAAKPPEEGPTDFPTAQRQLRLARVLLDLPADWLAAGVLETEVARALTAAETTHPTRAEKAALQRLANEVRQVWDQRPQRPSAPAGDQSRPSDVSGPE